MTRAWPNRFVHINDRLDERDKTGSIFGNLLLIVGIKNIVYLEVRILYSLDEVFRLKH